MQSRDGQPLSAALPGQYVVLRLHPTAGGPALFRSYSLSGAQSTEHYRISVKIEPNGAAGTYIREHVRVGDALDVSAPRGSFILQSDERPVVLRQCGHRSDACAVDAVRAVGSPLDTAGLLAARHARSAASPVRRRSPSPHARARRMAAATCATAGRARTTRAEDFNATGHLSRAVFEEVGVSRDADVYVCGPSRFMAEMKEALAAVGVAPERIHVELFNGSESMAPGVVAAADTSSTSACGRGRHWPARVVRAQRHRRTLEGVVIREHSGVGRGVRRPGSVVMPDRCVSQLRERSRLGRGRLRTGATRPACRRQPPRVLLTTASRRRHRLVTSGRTWRSRAPQISAKPTRGATNATSIAVVKIARTASERRLAIRRVRTGTSTASARAST